MKAPEPQAEHRWLQGMAGEWTAIMSCVMAPGQPPSSHTSTELVRMLGELWTVGEGKMEDGGTSVMILGYDPAQKRFVGSFVASMMTHQWIYNGLLDSGGKVLTMNATGPSFAGDGTMGDYHDVFEFESDDVRTLTSFMLNADGTRTQFMKATYTRVK